MQPTPNNPVTPNQVPPVPSQPTASQPVQPAPATQVPPIPTAAAQLPAPVPIAPTPNTPAPPVAQAVPQSPVPTPVTPQAAPQQPNPPVPTPPVAAQQVPAQPATAQPATAQAQQPIPNQPIPDAIRNRIPRAIAPTPAQPAAAAPTAQPPKTAAAVPQKKLPPWLMPFATPQPATPIDPKRKLGVFTGVTTAIMAPLVYGAAVGLTGYGIFYHCINNRNLLEPGNNMSLLSFYGPIVGGAILLLFFVAPFFLSRPQKQTTYRVDTNENPALLALVEAVASHVGAPAPTRISASLDNSIRVEKNDDSQLEVILGLPLVAVQTARQTSGFLAHELYKFSSRPSAKTWGLTKLIQGLFERSAYECGEEQQEVVEWGGSLRKPASVTFGFIPWLFERLVAKSCDDLAENMVLDADRSQTRVAGSSTFAMSQLDRRLLDELAIMSQEGFAAAREVGQKSENLPAFYANKLNILKTERPDYVKRVCQELMQTKGETKPCIANRIAVAQSYKDEGIFPADKPSAGLFKDFTRFCRSTTALHYDRHFGTEIEQTKSRLAEESAKKAAAQAAAEAKQKADAEAAIAAQAARVQAQEAADQLAAQQAAAQLAQQQQAAQAQQQQAAAQQPPVPTAVAAAAPVAAAVAGAAAVAAQQTNVPPAPPVAPVPVQPVPVTPPTTPQPPVAQEHLPAVPAAAGVPTVGAASPSENWTGQDDTSDNPIAPRPVDTPSGTPVGQPATQAAPQPIVAQTPTPQTAAAPSPPGQLNQNQDYLSTYLQTDVLTTNYHLFLPFDQPAPAPDPEQAARALLAARQRYEQVYVARKPELNQIASGRLRLRSLQMARTMSLVGLPIGAEGLGLPEASNLAAATACDEQVQTLNSLREQIGELTEQATLRFTLATQLAETKIVAQSVGLQPNEVQSVRVAVSCIAQLKNVLPLIEQLGLQQRQLRCLLFNLSGNEHLEELTTCLSLTAGELAESIRQLQESFPAMTQFAQSFGIEVPAVAQPDEDDAQAIVDEASKRLALFDQLYQQSLTVLAFVADRVERHFSPPPVPQPTT